MFKINVGAESQLHNIRDNMDFLKCVKCLLFIFSNIYRLNLRYAFNFDQFFIMLKNNCYNSPRFMHICVSFNLTVNNFYMNLKFFGAVALLLGLINPLNAMPFDPLIGTWKVIDDRTGYYVSEIVIRKNSKTQQYSAVVTKNRQAPGVENPDACGKCQGVLKDQPIFGMEVLKGMVANNSNTQFKKGVWLSIQDGQTYDIEARLNDSRDQMKVFGKAINANTTSAMTWKKF